MVLSIYKTPISYVCKKPLRVLIEIYGYELGFFFYSAMGMRNDKIWFSYTIVDNGETILIW